MWCGTWFTRPEWEEENWDQVRRGYTQLKVTEKAVTWNCSVNILQRQHLSDFEKETWSHYLLFCFCFQSSGPGLRKTLFCLSLNTWTSSTRCGWSGDLMRFSAPSCSSSRSTPAAGSVLASAPKEEWLEPISSLEELNPKAVTSR